MVKPISEKFNALNFPEELANLPLLEIPRGREYLIYNAVGKLVRIYNNLFGADLISYSATEDKAIHVKSRQGGKFNFLVNLQSIYKKSPKDGELGQVIDNVFADPDFYTASELLHDFFHQIFDPELIVQFYSKGIKSVDHYLEEFFIFEYFGDDWGSGDALKEVIRNYSYRMTDTKKATKYPEFYKLVDLAMIKFPVNYSRELPEELTNYVKKLYKLSHRVFDESLSAKLEQFSTLAIEVVKEMEKKATKLPKLEDTIEIPKKIPLKDVPQFILELKHVRDVFKGKQ